MNFGLTLPQGVPLHPRRMGVYLTLRCTHGDADATTSETVFFEPTDDGIRKAQMLMDAFGHLNSAVARDVNTCTEDVCEYVATKTGHSADELFELLEPLIRTDAAYDEHIAVPTSYVLCVVEKGGFERNAVVPCG